MRIVIDLQGAQTVSRYRGIGRYTLALVEAIVQHRGEHEIFLVLNGLFPETIQPIRTVFKDLLPQTNICIWETPPPGAVREADPCNFWRREIGEQLREAFLLSLKPDIIWVCSLFEGYTDNAITNVKINANVPVIVTIYDLIPLLNPQIFFQDERFKNFYLRQISQLKQADKCLAISAASADEARSVLNVDKNWIVELPSGFDLRFRPLNVSAQEREHLFQQLGITKSFILYVGADDDRKNLPRLIQAYAKLSDPVRSIYQLLIVGKLSLDEHGDFALKKHVNEARVSNQELLLIDYVDDDALVKLYNLCEVFILPSWHEGFGLSAVEAMACGKAVIGSNTSSIPEVIGCSDALFDPFDIMSINQKLEQVLTDQAFRIRLAEHGLKQVKKFSWVESAQCCIESFEQVSNHHKLKKQDYFTKTARLKLVFVSALLPGSMGFKQFILLLTELIKYYEIQLIVQGEMDDFHLPVDVKVRSAGWLSENFQEIDRVVYHLTNTPLSIFISALIEKIPGIIILDEFSLSDLFYYGEPRVWIETLYHSHGYQAVRERYISNNTLDVKIKYPVNLKIIQYSLGVIVVSELTRQLGEDWYGPHFSQEWKVITDEQSFSQQAELYAEAIEYFYSLSSCNPIILANSIVQQKSLPNTLKDWEITNIASAISQNLPLQRVRRQLLLDISIILRQDYKTGIQRVVRGLLIEFLQTSPMDYRIEPVYLSDEGGRWHYKYARKYTLALMNCPSDSLQDDVVEVSCGDLLFGLDLTGQMLLDSVAQGLHTKWKHIGVKIYFLVYDLLPVLYPQVFPQGAYENFFQWLKVITQFDGAVCISKTVADDLQAWLEKNGFEQSRLYHITWAHLGADIENSAPSGGLPDNVSSVLALISQRPSFIMVGTIEPRKGYLQVIEAFSLLWQQSIDVNLIIIGRQGWDILPNSLRGTIPEIIRQLRTHPEVGKRLFWFEGISDEYLKKIYGVSSCLIAASLAEGFGLPLIEAARNGVPIIARDIPIFREVAGSHAYYFQGMDPIDLANAIKSWLVLYDNKQHPSSHLMPWFTWKESAENILSNLPL